MSNYTRWYRDGSVDVMNGSKVVTGTSTYWTTAGLNAGDIVKINGGDYELESVSSDTKLNLKTAYSGANLSKAEYAIVRNFTATPTSKIAAQASELLGDFARYIDTDMQKLTGKSAYQSAKDNGYTGTEAQWVKDIQTGGGYSELKQRTDILTYHNAGSHNAKFRGKILVFDSALSQAIRADTFGGTYDGKFVDVYPGDVFNFNNVAYSYKDENDETQQGTYSGTMRVMDLDYFLRCGDIDLTTHHIVIVPDHSMFYVGMNDTDTTKGGYVGSKMRTIHLRRAEAIFKACFGADHLLAHRERLVNAVKDGKPSGGAWCDCIVELMDERMVYGSLIFDSGNPDGTNMPDRYSIGNSQLNAFRHEKHLISNKQTHWLTNVVSAASFAYVNDGGGAVYGNASYSCGVRPYALIY